MSKVLRASKAGFPCERNLWYTLNTEPSSDDEPDERTERIFEMGTCLEPLMVEWLRRAGWEVEYNAGSQNAELEVHVPLRGGELAGHPDCFISRGELRNVLVDIKTMNERSFTKWRREGSVKSKPQYVDQVHIYAEGCRLMGREITKLGIAGLNKNNGEWHLEIFDYDAERMSAIRERTERVLTAVEPPADGSPKEDWCCGYCEYSEDCPCYRRLSRASETASTEQAAGSEVVNAMRELYVAREQVKEARDREARAKALLEGYVKSTGEKSIKGGGLRFQLLERESRRFDAERLRKEHPELAQSYDKVVKSVVYDVKEVE